MKYSIFYSIVFISILVFSCKEDEPVISKPGISVNIKDLAADPTTGRDPLTGAPIGDKNQFTFFRFRDSSLIELKDSASLKWDIGFKGSTIILNGGTSGPGAAAGFVYNGLFSELKEVPKDSSFITDNSPNFAIGKTWYNYIPTAMILEPKPGKVFVIRTSDNKYVKMAINSYYKGSPVMPNAFVDQDRFYTFYYVYQGDGTTKFE